MLVVSNSWILKDSCLFCPVSVYHSTEHAVKLEPVAYFELLILSFPGSLSCGVLKDLPESQYGLIGHYL